MKNERILNKMNLKRFFSDFDVPQIVTKEPTMIQKRNNFTKKGQSNLTALILWYNLTTAVSTLRSS